MTNPTTITAQPGTPFIDIVREFDATPAQVFRAQTDPDLLGQWLGPRGVEIEVIDYDARPGGSYRYLHRDAHGEFGFRGVFHTVVPNEIVIQTFEFEGVPHQVAIETMTLTELPGGRARLHTHSVYPSVESRDAAVATGMEHGIRDSMDRLEELATTGRPTGTGRVVVDITMSVDGYVTAAGAGPDHGLGVGGESLHTWLAHDGEIQQAQQERTGAVIMGRNTFDVIDGPKGWSEELVSGEGLPPIFVMTHSAPRTMRLPRGRFSFVSDLKEVVEQARAAAGGKDVVIMGGGTTCHAFLESGLVDTLILHVSPVVLGDGTPLFPRSSSASVNLERLASVSTPYAEHITYRVKTAG